MKWNLLEHKNKSSLELAIINLKYTKGATNATGALWRLHYEAFTPQNGDRADVPNIALFFSDGKSNYAKRQTVPEAEIVHSKGTSNIIAGTVNIQLH